jgi:hypothetical protein
MCNQLGGRFVDRLVREDGQWKVKLGEMMKSLPKGVATVTPEEREKITRERRRALQERPLW